MRPPAAFTTVQALRALAALAVIFFHAAKMVHGKLGAAAFAAFPGSAGVDLFFAVSGFIIVMSTQERYHAPGAWKAFVRKRALRVVPLYWLMTALMLLLLFLKPVPVPSSRLAWWHAAASFLFIPAWNEDHEAFPLIVAGWTLSFEIVFYALFAVAMRLRLRATPWLSGLFLSLAIAGLFRNDSWGAPARLIDPILLEFTFGMGIAAAATRNAWLPSPVAYLLVPATLLAILATGFLPFPLIFSGRVLFWGVPSALLLASVVALEVKRGLRAPRWAVILGDASYALYLSHGFVITGVALLLFRFSFSPLTAAWIGVTTNMIASIIVGLLVHRWVERPLMRLSRAHPSFSAA